MESSNFSSTSLSIRENTLNKPLTIPIGLKEYVSDPKKPWRVGEKILTRMQSSPKPYSFQSCKVLLSDPEYDFVLRYFMHQKPPGYSIAEISCIHNTSHTQGFEAELNNIEHEAQKFPPNGKLETHAKEREQAINKWQMLTQQFSPLELEGTLNGAKVIPLWQGNKEENCLSICDTGFTGFGKHVFFKGSKDVLSTGFGNGIYFTTSADYASKYSQGHLLLSWVSMREPYPIISDQPHPKQSTDMQTLQGKGAYQNYNAHYIPVASIFPNDPNNLIYYPCYKGQGADWDELVVFQKSQTLSRFWVKLAVDLPHGIDNNNDSIFDPCYQACKAGDLSRLEALLQKDKKLLQQVNVENETLLYGAVHGNQLALLQWLHAQVPSLLKIYRTDGWNLMHVAAAEGHVAIVQWLLNQYPLLLYRQTVLEKWTPLHCAVFNEKLLVLECFVSQLKQEKALLEKLAEMPCPKSLDFLLKNGIDPNTSNRFKQTLLHLAAQAGQEENVRCLLQHQTSINAQDLSGRTPLFLAVLQGHRHIVQLLLQEGADCTLSSGEQETVLHAAAFYGHTPILQDLLKNPQAKQLIHAKDSDGKIPLHKAVWGAPKPDVVQLLLDQGSDPNAKNIYNYTPLHWACKHGHIQSFNLLLKTGAQLNVANDNHDLPLDLAIRWGRDDLFHALMETTSRLPNEKVPEDIEGYFFQCLIKAHTSQMIEEKIVYLQRLGEFYIQKEEFLKGAKLFNAALAVLQKQSKNPLIESYLFHRLAQLEVRFLESLGLKVSETKSLTLEYRAELKKIREAASKAIENKKEIQLILWDLTQKYKQLLTKIITPIQALLGPPPVKWACMGLGSMSRGEMCPYSDLEFAFLLEKSTEEALKYFLTLAQILEFRIINMGETRFPIFAHVDPLHPSPTSSGFALDTGGNTPLGVKDVYELIGTPKQLAQFEGVQWMERNIILPNAMSTVCFIAGDEKLVSQYDKEKTAVLDKKQSKKSNREELAFRLLADHLEEFRPNLSREKETIKAFGIKKELYRPFQEGLSCLALYYNLQEKSSLARIEELHKLKIFSAKGAENLKEAIRRVLNLRFEVHLFYQDEQEYLCHPVEGKSQDPSLLYVTKTHIEALHAIYRVLLPFHKCLEVFFHTKDKKAKALNNHDFYDEGPSVQAEVLTKTLQYQKAQEAYQQAVALNPNDVHALLFLGFMNDTLGDSHEALQRAQQALKIAFQKYGEKHPDVATSYGNIGSAYYSLGRAQEAVEFHRKAGKIRLKIYGKKHPDVATSYGNIGLAYKFLGRTQEAVEFQQKALKIRLKIYGKEHLHDVAASYGNIGLAYYSLGRTQKAVKFHQKALKIELKIYGEEHPHVAISYNNIGSAYNSLGRTQEAVEFHLKALKIMLKIYGEEHPHVATSYNHIGSAYDSLGRNQEAVEFYQKALKILLKIYGEEHPDVATSYSWMATIFEKLGDNEQAKECYLKAERAKGKKS